MAGLPGFGGTNGVPELDAGQPGSGRDGSGLVAYRPHFILHEPEVADVEQAAPEQNVVLVNRLGFRGQKFTWEGQAKFKDASEITKLRSVLNQFLTGSAIVAGVLGSPGSPDPSYLQPTQLLDASGELVAAKARMSGFLFPGRQYRITGDAAWMYRRKLIITFRIGG